MKKILFCILLLVICISASSQKMTTTYPVDSLPAQITDSLLESGIYGMLYINEEYNEQYLFIINNTKMNIYLPTAQHHYLLVESTCYDVPEWLFENNSITAKKIPKASFLVATYPGTDTCTFDLEYKTDKGYRKMRKLQTNEQNKLEDNLNDY